MTHFRSYDLFFGQDYWARFFKTALYIRLISMPVLVILDRLLFYMPNSSYIV
jgi:hypothetical protein